MELCIFTPATLSASQDFDRSDLADRDADSSHHGVDLLDSQVDSVDSRDDSHQAKAAADKLESRENLPSIATIGEAKPVNGPSAQQPVILMRRVDGPPSRGRSDAGTTDHRKSVEGEQPRAHRKETTESSSSYSQSSCGSSSCGSSSSRGGTGDGSVRQRDLLQALEQPHRDNAHPDSHVHKEGASGPCKGNTHHSAPCCGQDLPVDGSDSGAGCSNDADGVFDDNEEERESATGAGGHTHTGVGGTCQSGCCDGRHAHAEERKEGSWKAIAPWECTEESLSAHLRARDPLKLG